MTKLFRGMHESLCPHVIAPNVIGEESGIKKLHATHIDSNE